MIPTVGFNMRKVTKGNVTIKVEISVLLFTRSFGISVDNHAFEICGRDIAEELMRLCKISDFFLIS
jgi:hypothetical protein